MCPYLQRLKPGSDQEENELVILHLRQLCETRQKSHLHIGEAPQVRAADDETNPKRCTAEDILVHHNELGMNLSQI